MNQPAVFITGAAKRIGAEIARAFSASGWHVIIHYGQSVNEAQALAASLPSAETVQCDLSDGEAAHQMIERFSAQLSDWRVLINCASVFRPDDVTNADPEAKIRTMQINALTPARMAQVFLHCAKSRSGRRVIQITDQKLENPNPDFFTYSMSKYALAATIPMLAMGECGPDDRTYGLAPGAILASHDQTEEETEQSHRLNLLERKTAASELADAALFLAEGWLASGETLFIDSGQHLLRQPRDVIYLAREGAEG